MRYDEDFEDVERESQKQKRQRRFKNKNRDKKWLDYSPETSDDEPFDYEDWPKEVRQDEQT